MRKVMVILADGFEEIEAVSVIDILRRADIPTEIIGLKEGHVTSARGLAVMTDGCIDSVNPDEYEMIVLPGGLAGAKNIDESEKVEEIVKLYLRQEKYVAAICASSYILAKKGLLHGRMATCFPTFKGIVEVLCDFQNASVVVDENIITSRGPGTAAEFAFTIVELLRNEDEADRLREAMLFK